MKLINLNHGEFMVLGGYIAFFLSKELGFDPLLGVVIAEPAVALIAYPMQRYLLSPVMSRGAGGPCS
jgi:branched-chain amino acid transport system permease protein